MKPFSRRQSIFLALWALSVTLGARGAQGRTPMAQRRKRRPALARIVVRIDTATRHQVIDGFGTCLAGPEGQAPWWQELYYDDLGASILRVDLTPRFVKPYSAFTYNSPWHHGNPGFPGPDGNNVRTYTGPEDYSALWAGRSAPIAVMQADAAANIDLFDYTNVLPASGGAAAQAGRARAAQLGDFKLIGSIWSPAPWIKETSGRAAPRPAEPNHPAEGTPWPFIWGDNFAGGRLDTSGDTMPLFNDGVEHTSALTQFARATAAYVLGYQREFGVQFYAISIQNELNFERFYSSALYQHTSDYIAALKAVRAEFDRYDELRPIMLMGPEDVLGNDAYTMWTYRGGFPQGVVVHKNLRHLRDIEADAEASAALAFYNVHSYNGDQISSAEDAPIAWGWWANGWTTRPDDGLPQSASGFTAYGKKSWMTETSDENPAWLFPAGAFPGSGAWSIALRIHRALTTGRQSAWLYWQLTNNEPIGRQTLTDSTLRGAAPKYVAFKHFARFIRPHAQRVEVTIDGVPTLHASAYVHDGNRSLTAVLVNSASNSVTAVVQLPATSAGLSAFQVITSKEGSLWQEMTVPVADGAAQVDVPGFGVTTLHAVKSSAPLPTTKIYLPQADRPIDPP